MASVIRVTPEKLKSTARTMESEGNKVKNYTQQMNAIVQALSGRIWSGQAAQAYKSKFNGLNDDIAKLHKLIQENVQHLDQIAAEYERAENENTQASGNLSADVII